MPSFTIPHATFAITLDALLGRREDELAEEWCSVVDAQAEHDLITLEASARDVQTAIEILREAAEIVVEDPSDFAHESAEYIAAAEFWVPLLETRG